MLPVLGKKAVLEWCMEEGLIGSSYVSEMWKKYGKERTESEFHRRSAVRQRFCRFCGRCSLQYCHTHNLLQVPIAELAERWTELPQVSDESRSFFRVHTGYFSNIPKCIKAEFIASWACSQSSVVSSSKR
ncbi:hypothetical protein TNCV_1777391 [Trichonephila clavipes]|nr:hypothetical protein TNCV_1777391 [Trichonephila clavipes]